MAQATKPDTTKPKEASAIADNSFLIEEAYNQEAGVAQHISTYQRARSGSLRRVVHTGVACSIHQAPAQLHHPYLKPDGLTAGIGDIALNYRYQAIGKDEEQLWFAPRLSVYLPTGDVNAGRGIGGAGLELMLPLSLSVSSAIVTHYNAAGSISRADNGLGGSTNIRAGRLGASVIWLAKPTFNLMLESTLGRTEFIGVAGRVASGNSFVISPGARGAFNFASGLQIVPGLAFPIGIGPSSGQRDVFVYLELRTPIQVNHEPIVRR